MPTADHDLPPRLLAWVCERLGGERVDEVGVLTGGCSSQMYAVRSGSGRAAVLRRLTIQPWRRFAASLLRREYAVQSLLADAGLPVPRPIAVDVEGTEAGDPCLLMSRLPGSVDLVRDDDDYLRRLAGLLVRLHAFVPPPGRWPREYQSWAFPAKRVVPPWSTDDGLWREAFTRLAEEPPAYTPTFLHRDYYPSNVLWQDGEITGLVDWVETSTGPADLDVAHCCSNLASIHGAACAQPFREAYQAAGGVLAGEPDARRYWQLMDLIAFLPDGASARESGATGATVEEMWAANGRPDLSRHAARGHREDLLRVILG